MGNIFYSIGIPAYKTSYLKECIDSIIAQTYPHFELIIVNDASPQNIDEIVKSYDDDRIRYYVNDKNYGAEHVVDNWNKCLSYATGEFFILMGDDDKMMPDYLSEFALLINKYPDLDVYHCRSYIIDERSEKIELTPSWPECESLVDNIWHRIKGYRQQFISDFVYKTDHLISVGGFFKIPLGWGSDDISSYIAIGNKYIAHTNKPVFSYRRSDQTISSKGNSVLKMRAVMDESSWFQSNLQKFILADNKDEIIYKRLPFEIYKYIQKKKAKTITDSLSRESFKLLFYWYRKRKEFGLSNGIILYAILEYLKRCRTKKYNYS